MSAANPAMNNHAFFMQMISLKRRRSPSSAAPENMACYISTHWLISGVSMRTRGIRS
jgi:hypothetical protein